MEDMSFEERDFVIRIRPSLDEDDWTGKIDISIISQADNPMNDDSYGQIMHFCKMMCATVPIMEQDEKLRNLVHSYVLEVVDDETTLIEEEEEGLIITKEDGNVVHLSFGSRTKGSA